MIKPSWSVILCSKNSFRFIPGKDGRTWLIGKPIMCSVFGVKNDLTHADSLYHIKLCLWLLPTFELPATISKPSYMRVPHLPSVLVIQQHASPWAHLCWMALSAETERAPEFMHVSSIHANQADCFFKTILQVLQKHIHFQEVKSSENIFFWSFFFSDVTLQYSYIVPNPYWSSHFCLAKNNV